MGKESWAPGKRWETEMHTIKMHCLQIWCCQRIKEIVLSSFKTSNNDTDGELGNETRLRSWNSWSEFCCLDLQTPQTDKAKHLGHPEGAWGSEVDVGEESWRRQ